MASRQSAWVFVDSEWYDRTIRMLLTSDPPSRSTTGVHLIEAAVKDLTDHRGLWLGPVVSDRVVDRDTGATTTMDLFIPWHFIQCLGLVDESAPRPTGFAGATVLTQPEPPTDAEPA